VVAQPLKEDDIDFNLEQLITLRQGGDRKSFEKVAKRTLMLVEFEEDLQDLLEIAIDFYSCIDSEEKEKQLQEILSQRRSRRGDEKVLPDDPRLAKLF
jgi:hypothetical protein